MNCNYLLTFCLTVGLVVHAGLGLPAALQFSSGDVIKCEMSTTAGFFPLFHFALALDSSQVIHVSGVGDTKTKNFYIETLSAQRFSSKYKYCTVVTRYNDGMIQRQMSGSRGAPYGASEVVARARRSLTGNRVFYNLATCNCEHWVNYWRYGVAFSEQTFNLVGFNGYATDSRCPLPNQGERISGNGPQAWTRKEHGSVHTTVGAEASTGSVAIGNSLGTLRATGPSAGADVKAGAFSGYELRASLGEVSADIGGVVEATAGLSADTGIYAGDKQRYGFRLIGSGIDVGSKGLKMCLFGSCLRIG